MSSDELPDECRESLFLEQGCGIAGAPKLCSLIQGTGCRRSIPRLHVETTEAVIVTSVNVDRHRLLDLADRLLVLRESSAGFAHNSRRDP
ncbi:MAG: hypothetical protein WBV28_03405 [Terracidiphilus sp.]